VALARFINEGTFARHLLRTRAVCAERRTALTHELRRQLGSAILRIDRGAALRLVVRLNAEMRDMEIARAAADNGIHVVPCSQWTGESALLIEYGAMPATEARAFVMQLNAAIDANHSSQLC
jgi:GntR family transcriptional regulator/MocR family aminotransferase